MAVSEKFIRIPKSLSKNSRLVMLLPLLFMLEWFIFLHVSPLESYWKTAHTLFFLSVFGVACVFSTLLLFTFSFSPVLFTTFLVALFSVWSVANLIFLFLAPHFWFAVVTLLSIFSFAIYMTRLRKDLRRSYVNSFASWYHAIPALIPHFEVEAKEEKFRASRLDREGVYLHGKNYEILRQKEPFEIKLILKDVKLTARVRAVSLSERHQGVGLAFEFTSPLDRKEVYDFYERTKGAGWV